MKMHDVLRQIPLTLYENPLFLDIRSFCRSLDNFVTRSVQAIATDYLEKVASVFDGMVDD